LADILKEEEKLDVEGLVNRAVHENYEIFE